MMCVWGEESLRGRSRSGGSGWLWGIGDGWSFGGSGGVGGRRWGLSRGQSDGG
jgi:hypothetical protein